MIDLFIKNYNNKAWLQTHQFNYKSNEIECTARPVLNLLYLINYWLGHLSYENTGYESSHLAIVVLSLFFFCFVDSKLHTTNTDL